MQLLPPSPHVSNLMLDVFDEDDSVYVAWHGTLRGGNSLFPKRIGEDTALYYVEQMKGALSQRGYNISKPVEPPPTYTQPDITYEQFRTSYTYDPSKRKGKGGFGKVFEAWDNVDDRPVAIKIAEVRPGLENRRLRNEVELAKGLPRHPNIAKYETCYTFMREDGEYDFAVMQLYESGDLSSLLHKGELTVPQKESVLRQIMDGLDFLHSNGVIHRDMKPQNVLIGRRGDEYIPKITDFGISKKVDTEDSFNDSLHGAGSLLYTSPEQIRGNARNRNTDLWSLGVIVFQTFTGRLPFYTNEHTPDSDGFRMAVRQQVFNGELPDTIASVPEPWQTLVRRCLVVDPAQRVRNISDCLDILAQATDACANCSFRDQPLEVWCVECNNPGSRLADPTSAVAQTQLDMAYEEFRQRYQYDKTTDILGRGGFCRVFKAFDNVRNRNVAIKETEVRPGFDNIRLRKVFELTSNLPLHRNITKIEECYTFTLDYGEVDFGVMQFYEHRDLSSLMKFAEVTMPQKISILTQILDGLELLHDYGIIHRDIKPQNILITKRGDEYIPTITDFLLAMKTDSDGDVINDLPGAGTLAYASPEQLKDTIISKRTDLWSFGVIAFQMFTGQLPFDAGTYSPLSEEGRSETLRQIFSGTLPRSLTSVPEPWQTLMRRCLVVNPSERVRNVAECRDILAQATKEDEVVMGSYANGKYSAGLREYQYQHYQRAFDYFREAAEQGHADAQNYLGYMYHVGQGVIKDEVRAVLSYRKAAAQGHTIAKYNLGVLHEDRGMSDIAIKWYRLAANEGNEPAQDKLKALGYHDETDTIYDNEGTTSCDETKKEEWYT